MNWRIFLIILSLATLPALAQQRREFYNGVRALGMGGAGVATANDETALLINPAGLGRLRDYYVTLIDPEVDIGQDTEKVMGTDVIKLRDPQDALNKANLTPDKYASARAQVFPSIVLPNFGFGIFGKYEMNAEVDTTANKFEYQYINDFAAVFGFNFRFWDGIIKVGANARIINRVEVDRDDIDPTSTTLTLDNLASEGIGVGSDAGILLALPVAYLPTLGAVYRDAGRTSYTLRDGLFVNTTERPNQTPSSLDVGLSLFPIHGKSTRTTWTVEYRDVLTYSEETSHTRRIHGGVELNFADAIFLRGGMHQGYWTAGLEIAIINYQMQFATYGEEIGTADTPRVDRRYVGKVSFRF